MPLSSAKTPPIGFDPVEPHRLRFPRTPSFFYYRRFFHQRWNISPIFWVKNNYIDPKTVENRGYMEYKEIKVGNFIYLVSSNGDIYRKLKPTTDVNGYKVINIGGRKTPLKKIHRLVAQCFLPNPDNLPAINHKDENPLNNCVDNLEWCTIQYNNSYGTKAQRTAISNSKPVVQCDKQTHEPINYFISAKVASEQFKVPENARKRIVEVCKDIEDIRYHSAYGYWWRYAIEEEIKEHHLK